MFMLLLTSIPLTLSIGPINEIEIDPLPLVNIYPSHAKETLIQTGTYALTTNGEQKKIIGKLQAPLPENTYLSICLEAPPGAVSHGNCPLSLEPTILVSGISKIAKKDLKITYTFYCAHPNCAGSYPQIIHFTLID